MSNVKKELFGSKDGKDIYLYTLENGSGTSVSVMTLGATIRNIWLKDKNGVTADVITGYDRAEDYPVAGGYSGAVVGRVCNRIANARFTLDGEEYVLYANDGKHQLHGGKEGFCFKVWDAEASEGDEPSLKLTYLSPDGEESYPGNLIATATYTLKKDGALAVDFSAVTDKATVVSMTSHAYYNMGGYASGTVDDHVLWVDADCINEIDTELIPTGRFLPVDNTPYDLREPTRLGGVLESDEPMIKFLGGLDNNYVINNADGKIKKVAYLEDTVSGRYVEVYSDQPCIQIYTSNMIDVEDVPFKNGVKQYKHCAVCLETQKMPDSVNHPEFTSVVLRPGERYEAKTVYAFGCK